MSDPTPTGPAAVFLSAVAQQDNLGDLVLRRVAVQSAVAAGAVPHVLTAGMSASFVDALELPPGAPTYRSHRSWAAALATPPDQVVHHLAFSPGPQSLAPGARAVLRALNTASTVALVTGHRGTVTKIGRSLSGSSALLRLLERRLARRCAVYTVRDERSAQLLGVGSVLVAPDVALADPVLTAPPWGPPRTLVALSFRGDRSVDVAALRALASAVRERGWEPVLVTQVQRDEPFHASLAAELGCEVASWPTGRSHTDQLAEVLQVYRRAQLVVSNRLHSLIFGLAMGATPLGLTTPDDPKITDAFGVVGLADRVWDRGGPVPAALLEPADLSTTVTEVRRRLRTVQDRVESALGAVRVG